MQPIPVMFELLKLGSGVESLFCLAFGGEDYGFPQLGGCQVCVQARGSFWESFGNTSQPCARSARCHVMACFSEAKTHVAQARDKERKLGNN